MSKAKFVALFSLALFVGVCIGGGERLAHAVSTIYRNAVIFGSGASSCDSALGKSCSGLNVQYWNSSDGNVHVHMASGTDYSVPQVSSISGTGYLTTEINGGALTNRNTLNLVGNDVSCADNPGSSRTDCTFSSLQFFNVKAYGAKGDGATNDSTAIQSAATAACVAGGVVYMPPGTYYMTTGVTVPCSYVRIVGSGPQATIVKFDPVGTASAFRFGTSSETNMTGISGIRFNSTGANTQAKTAVEFYDVSQPYLEDVWCDPLNSSTWTGANSTCLWLRGREAGTIRRLRAYCDRPIRISDDPNTAGTVDNDHMHFTDTYLRPTPASGNAAVLIDDGGVIVTNLSFDGYNAWIVDKYGLYWSETSGSTSNDNVLLQGVRCEQAQDSTGYCIYIDLASTVLYNLSMTDVTTTVNHNGIHLRGVSNPSIRNSIFFAVTNANTHLDIGTSVYDLVLDNNFVNPNALTNLGSLNKVWAAPQRQAGATMPSSARYTTSTGNMTVASISIDSGMSLSGETITNNAAANGGPIVINSANAYTGGNHLVEIQNAGTVEAYIDNGGDFFSSTGKFDTTGNTQQLIGANNAASVAIGRSGGSGVFISAPTMACASAGGCTVGGIGNYISTSNSRHYAGAGTAPTIAAGTGAGTSPTIAVAGTDSSGKITLTLGTTPSGTNAIVGTVTFNATWGASPHCFVVPANAAAVGLAAGAWPFVDDASTTTSVFVVKSGATALSGGPFVWSFKCEG